MNEGADRAANSPDSSTECRDSALATVLLAPGLYSTIKSKPMSLLTH
jgi:hypothetical protein